MIKIMESTMKVFSVLEDMNTLSNSNTYKEIEKELSGSVKNHIIDLIEKSNDSKYLVNQTNCPDLDDLFVKKKDIAFMPNFEKIKTKLDQGVIKIVYDKTNPLGKMIYAIPFQLPNAKFGGVIINASTFLTDRELLVGEVRRTDYLVSDNKKLIELLNMAYIVLEVANDHYPVYRNTKIRTALMELYSQMLLGVLTRSTHLASTGETAKEITYYVCNFIQYSLYKLKNLPEHKGFSANVAGISTDDAFILDRKIERYKVDANIYESLNDLIEFLKYSYSALKDLTLSHLTRKYNLSYSPLSILSLDYLPYLSALMVSGATGHTLVGVNFKKSFGHLTKLNSINLLNLYR